MRIAINATTLLSPHTGVGTYTYQIAKNLKNIKPSDEYTYFYGYYSDQLVSPGEEPRSFQVVKERIRKIPLLGSLARNANDFLNYFSSRKFDLYFEPNFIPVHIPAEHKVVTVFDFSFDRFPQWHSQDKVRYFKNHFWKKIHQADRIIVISDFIREEAIRHYHFPAERVTTIPPGIDRSIFKIHALADQISLKERYHLPDKFILYVGSIEPRKNLASLLKAYRALSPSLRKEYKIVLAGFKGWENDEIMGCIRDLQPDVLYIGYIPEVDLGILYNLAYLFVYPSLYEGFGLPPLEAMACGCPAIVSEVASLPEVCKDAAFYINPLDIGNITGGLERLLTDRTLRDSLISKGHERAEQFSWEKSAREHIKVFEEVRVENRCSAGIP